METNSGGQEREYPVAMIRRLVNDFVHDLRLSSAPHVFWSEADHLLSVSPAVFVASPAQETEDHISTAEPPCCRWSRFKDEFETVASASRLPCLDASHG